MDTANGGSPRNLNFRLFLVEEFERRRGLQRRFSLRAFAQFLRIDASSLQKLMVGKRPLGSKTIQNLGLRLGLSPEHIERFISAHKARKNFEGSINVYE